MKPTIGLEIHAHLKTQTKMFCDSLNDPNEQHPNVNICSVCTGHPGTLPTINKQAVAHVLKIGLALGGKLAKHTKFDRKNYFYPDLPKGYQLSQYDEPLVSGGVLLGVRLRRVHLEEDAGSLMHTKSGTLVDYNRAGVPLMELVTEPDITSARQAVDFARELQLIMRYLGISDADMDRGQMRIEANVSWSADDGGMGTKVELKNINSFAAVAAAIDYELARQADLFKKNKKIIQETRGWDDVKKISVSQRSKEGAHDYRYFPEPDLPPFDPSAFDVEALKRDLPELPAEKRKRFVLEFDLIPEKVELLVQNRSAANFFEEAVSELKEIRSASWRMELGIKSLVNYFTSDLWGLIAKEGTDFDSLKIIPEHFAHLVGLVTAGEITSRSAKDLLLKMFHTGADPHELVKSENLTQVSNISALQAAVEKIIAQNPAAVADYKKGKTNALQFLIGKTMGGLGGRANPQVLRQLFEKILR